MIFLKQAITEAAYQGALVGMKSDAEETDVNSRIQTILDARRITLTNIDLAGGNFATLSGGDQFTVKVTAQTSGNRLGPAIMTSLNQIESTASAIKQ